jgi:hypothetical protein
MSLLDDYLPRYIQIESGGNPNAQTGSYSGLLQMGPDEIAKYGGNGLEQGKQMYADRAAWFENKFGRPPTPTELYLTNQQGEGGVAAHIGNPDAPAWQNMYSTAEGQRRGEAWAKKAIWGNVPDDVKANYPGGVDSLTSQQFMNLWQNKVERTSPQQPFGGPPAQPQRPLPPQPLDLAAPQTGLPAFSWSPQQQAEQQVAQQVSPQQPSAAPLQIAQALHRPIDLSRLQNYLSQLQPAIRPYSFRG